MRDCDDDKPSNRRMSPGKRFNHNRMERKRRENMKDCFADLRKELPAFEGCRRIPSRQAILKETVSFLQRSSKKGPATQREINTMQTMQAEMQQLATTIAAATASGDFESAAPFVDRCLALKAESTPPSPENEEDDDERLEDDECLEDEEGEEDDTTDSDHSEHSEESNL